MEPEEKYTPEEIEELESQMEQDGRHDFEPGDDEAASEATDEAGEEDQEGQESEEEQGEDEGGEEIAAEGSEEAEAAESDEGGDDEVDLPSAESLLEQQLQLQRERADHWQRTHDALTGKVGQKIQQIRSEYEDRGRAADDYADEQQPTQQVTEYADDPRIDTVLASEQRRTYSEEATRFAAMLPGNEKSKQVLEQGVTAYMAQPENVQRLQSAFASLDPATMRIESKALMTEGLLHVVRERQKGVNERTQASKERVRARKRKATPSGAQKSRTISMAPKDPSKMTTEELEAEFRKEGRRGF